MPTYPFADWVAEQLRLTVFTLPGVANPAAEQWWNGIVGSPADESTANLKMGLKTLASTFHSGKLILKLEPDRIDWLFVPQGPDPAAGPPGELPSIGPITENLESFSDIAERWLGREDIPDVVRIAFGTVVRHPEPDRRSAYVRLPDYLPLRLNPESSDFNLQINIPTVSQARIDGLRINRLSRWSVMGLARVALSVDSARVTTSSQFMEYAMRLEVDINTSPEFQRPIPKERLIELYRELVTLGRSIITEGLPQ
jgi:hypothetical protein